MTPEQHQRIRVALANHRQPARTQGARIRDAISHAKNNAEKSAEKSAGDEAGAGFFQQMKLSTLPRRQIKEINNACGKNSTTPRR